MRQESPSLAALFGDFRKTMKPLSALLRPGISAEDDIESVEQLLDRLPPARELLDRLETFRAETQARIKEIRRSTSESSGRTLGRFLELCNKEGVPTREISSSRWRVASLTLDLERERARASFQYGRENVLAPRFVYNEQKLVDFFRQARTALEQFDIPDAKLCDAFSEAYLLATALGGRNVRESTGIPIANFQRAFRLSLARSDMSKDASARLRWPDFPSWAFVYSVDRYVALQGVPGAREIAFEPGAQSTPGITVHHLRPDDTPHKVSWVRRLS